MAAVNGVIRRFDQLDPGLRSRLTATGELRPAAGVLTRVSERGSAAIAAEPAPDPAPAPAPAAVGGAIDAGSGDALNTTV